MRARTCTRLCIHAHRLTAHTQMTLTRNTSQWDFLFTHKQKSHLGSRDRNSVSLLLLVSLQRMEGGTRSWVCCRSAPQLNVAQRITWSTVCNINEHTADCTPEGQCTTHVEYNWTCENTCNVLSHTGEGVTLLCYYIFPFCLTETWVGGIWTLWELISHRWTKKNLKRS